MTEFKIFFHMYFIVESLDFEDEKIKLTRENYFSNFKYVKN